MKTLVAIPCMDTVPVGFMRSVISLKMWRGAIYFCAGISNIRRQE